MKKNYLSDDEIYLRAVEPEDLEVLYRIENEPQLWDIGNLTVPYSRYLLKQYITNSSYDIFADKQVRFMIVRKSDDIPVGTIDVTDYVPLHHRGEIGVAVLTEHRRQGYAKAGLALMCEYVFEFLHFKQLYAHVMVDNEACMLLFSELGFVQVGLLKSWLYVEGEYKDVMLMQLFHI